MLVAYCKKHRKLSDNLRKVLANVVIEYLIEHKMHASPKLIEHIADTLEKNNFKSEFKVCLNTFCANYLYLIGNL